MTLCGNGIGLKIRRAADDQPVDETWQGDESGLWARLPEALSTFEKAFDVVTPLVGEAISLIHDDRPAADIVRDMGRDATRILGRCGTK